jgi:hypothetical protein
MRLTSVQIWLGTSIGAATRRLPFQGSEVVERPGKSAPPLTSTTGSGQQQ